jgi:WD40 repeat protein
VEPDKAPVTLKGHAGGVNAVAVSPDGKLLATTAGMDETVILWDLATSRPIQQLKARANRLAFSPDGKSLCTGSPDGQFTFWDLRRYQAAATFDAYRAQIAGLAFAPDGSLLVTSGTSGPVRLWKTATFQEADHPAEESASHPPFLPGRPKK